MSRACIGFEPYPQASLLVDYLARLFGMPAASWEAFQFWHRPGASAVWIAHRSNALPSAVRVETLGLVLFRQPPPRGYPTTAFLRRFGFLATRRLFWVNAKAGEFLMHGQALAIPADRLQRGPYIVRTPQAILGRGWARAGRLTLDCAKEWRKCMTPLVAEDAA